MKKKNNIAIVGATGLVGSMFLKVLEEYKVPINKLYCFASQKSAGKVVKYCNQKIKVQELKTENIVSKKIDYALFSAGSSVSKEFAPIFASNGAVVIDNSSAFRQNPQIPLIVPEVNMIKTSSKIIANPNCSTIQCMPPLFSLHKEFSLLKVDYVTFQAVSGSGLKGIKDLELTTQGKKPQFYPHPIYNNCLPQIGDFDSCGYSEEENKMINETRKILSLPDLKVSATCVRVPVENSHSICVTATFEKELDKQKVFEILNNTNGVKLVDDVNENMYPLATMASNTNDIYVGRIRIDKFDIKTLHFFCVADNIRKGAATNAVQILLNFFKN